MRDLPVSTVFTQVDAGVDARDWPLMFSVDPRPDESLLGLVARLAEENVVPSLRNLLSSAGVNRKISYIARSLRPADVERLAIFTEVSTADIIARLQPVANRKGSGLQSAYFGISLRADLIEHQKRRIAPAALRRDSYHRSIWQLKCFAFDPETMTLLTDQCPRCSKILRWSTSYGVHVCEYCEFDLRAIDTPMVPPQFRFNCNWAANLVSHKQSLRRRALAELPAPLRHWEEGEVLDLVIRLAPFLDKGKSGGSAPRLAADYKARLWSPERLANSLDLVLDWPNAFFKLCDLRRAAAKTRKGYFGAAKELADIANCVWTTRQPERFRKLLRSAIDEYYGRLDGVALHWRGHSSDGQKSGMVTLKCISEEIGCRNIKTVSRVLNVPGLKVIRNNDTKRSPVMVDRAKILEWNAIRLSLENNFSAQRRTGIPEFGLIDLVRRGVIEIGAGPGVLMAGNGIWFYKAGIDRLLEKFGAYPAVKNTGCHQTLAQYVTACVGVPKPWGSVIQALLTSPQLVVGRLQKKDPIAFTIIVDQHGLNRIVDFSGLDTVVVSANIPVNMSTTAAAQYLDTTESAIIAFVNAGLIKVTIVGSIRRTVRASVEKFGRKYMIAGQAARALGMDRYQYYKYLRERGVDPVKEITKPLIWLRKDIERVCRELGRNGQSGIRNAQ